jgi:putative transposase
MYEHVFFGNAEILPKKNSKKTKKRLRQEQRLKDRQNEKICKNSKINKVKQNNISKTSSSQKPIKHSRKRKGLNRSRLDAAWGKQNQSLQYKGRWTGRTVEKVDEKYTSVSCFRCKSLTGPRGQSMLTVRVWVCSNCGFEHERDENSSEHIGERGMKIHSLSWKNLSARAEASASFEACYHEQVHREHEQPTQKVG